MNACIREVLAILDQCCDKYTFPMLDNGYVYLAATRLSVYRSQVDWALVIEVFGFSPRAGLPDTHISTFASRLHNRDTVDNFVNEEAYHRYLEQNPNNDSATVFPIAEGEWRNEEDCEWLADSADQIAIRGRHVQLPLLAEYAELGIELADAPAISVHEACRYLAAKHRDLVLATETERRSNVPPDLEQILQLEEWHHPDVVDPNELPSGSETFQQLAKILCGGDVTLYQPSLRPNTHWKHWPDGGTL